MQQLIEVGGNYWQGFPEQCWWGVRDVSRPQEHQIEWGAWVLAVGVTGCLFLSTLSSAWLANRDWSVALSLWHMFTTYPHQRVPHDRALPPQVRREVAPHVARNKVRAKTTAAYTELAALQAQVAGGPGGGGGAAALQVRYASLTAVASTAVIQCAEVELCCV